MKTYYSNKKRSIATWLVAGLFLMTSMVKAQCTANFTYTTGANGSAYFTSTSTGTLSSTYYSWNFAPGNGYGPTTMHNFTSNGYHYVCLTILDSSSTPGCNSVYCDSVLITNAPTNTCTAYYYYTLGSNGTVNFTSASTGTSSSTHYTWNFGGGPADTANGLSISHTFPSNGYKTVCLTIADSWSNCGNTACFSIQVTNAGTTTPCAAYSAHTVGANGTVNFKSYSTGTTSTTHYSWSFGDSSYGIGSTPSHTYTANGFYTVCLTISDSSSNCYDTYCDTVNITNSTCSPSVVYYLAKDSTQNLTWDAFPSYPSNITGATWYWGDGSSTTGLYPSHTYSAAGTYSTCVTVSVSCGTVTATYCYVATIFRGSQTSDMIVLNVRPAGPTGISTVTKKDVLFNIYPNPNAGSFTIEQNELTGDSGGNKLYIYNMLGEKVFEKNISPANKQNIDINELSNGTYFVKLISDTDCYTKKISVQK